MAPGRRWNDDVERPLDHLILRSARTQQSNHFTQVDGARNLMVKALRALDHGDDERARHYVQVACKLPYDEREQMHHGPWAAHMELYTRITDAVEETEEGDEDWLDASLELMDRVDGIARRQVGTVLNVLAHSYTGLEISASERRRIERAVDAPRSENDLGLEPDADLDAQVAVAWPLLKAAHLFEHLYAEGYAG